MTWSANLASYAVPAFRVIGAGLKKFGDSCIHQPLGIRSGADVPRQNTVYNLPFRAHGRTTARLATKNNLGADFEALQRYPLRSGTRTSSGRPKWGAMSTRHCVGRFQVHVSHQVVVIRCRVPRSDAGP
jgi:hypothetical protein